jgi:hypothetical protein
MFGYVVYCEVLTLGSWFFGYPGPSSGPGSRLGSKIVPQFSQLRSQLSVGEFTSILPRQHDQIQVVVELFVQSKPGSYKSLDPVSINSCGNVLFCHYQSDSGLALLVSAGEYQDMLA